MTKKDPGSQDGNDNASIQSSTSSVWSTLTKGNKKDYIPTMGKSSASIDVYAEVVTGHDHFKADTEALARAGIPARYGSRLSGDRKKLSVQFLKRTLQTDEVVLRPSPKTPKDLEASRAENPDRAGTRKTLMEVMSANHEVKAMKSSKVVATTLSYLFKGTDIRETRMRIPRHVCVRVPSSVRLDSDQCANVEAKWVSLTLTGPPALLEKANLNNINNDVSTSPSDEDILKNLADPSAEEVQLLDRVIFQLRRRGVIWSRAAHVCRPNSARQKGRPQFIVEGLCPVPLLDRCTAYCGRSSNDDASHVLAAEEDELESAKTAPFIVFAPSDSLDDAKSRSLAEEDVLQGWHVKITNEPFQIGLPLAVSPAGLSATIR